MVAGDSSQAVVVMMVVQASDMMTNQSSTLMLSGDVTCQSLSSLPRWQTWRQLQDFEAGLDVDD